MVLALVFWLLCLVINVGLLASVFHSLLILTDLEADDMGPFEATAQINRWILPEYALQAFFCALFLLTGHWVMFLVTLPLTCYHVMLYVKRRHLLDVTEVFRNLNFDKKYMIAKLCYYMVFFCIVVFRLVWVTFHTIKIED